MTSDTINQILDLDRDAALAANAGHPNRAIQSSEQLDRYSALGETFADSVVPMTPEEAQGFFDVIVTSGTGPRMVEHLALHLSGTKQLVRVVTDAPLEYIEHLVNESPLHALGVVYAAIVYRQDRIDELENRVAELEAQNAELEAQTFTV